ncbi:MAG: hypothetical protein KGM97_03335 [Alphaproteobacteria bacterium]|nr:hypothetical protein [Alphaproteobacteria bacterium]MDE2630003.1 hypothetical protein [Alphaproteobacteria bacterium]
MATTLSILSFDPMTLLNYYQAQLSVAAAATSASGTAGSTSSSSASSSTGATAKDQLPWENLSPPSQQTRDAQVLATANFLDTSKVPTLHSSAADAKTEQDNQNLFALYNAVNNVSYLASMAQRSTMTAGQLVGLNTRFQTGMQQIESFIKTATFNNFTLQAAAPSSSVTSTAQVPFATFGYSGGTVVGDANIAKALPGLSVGDSFTVAVTKGGTTTNVAIDLSQVQGALSIDNIVNYVNQQLMGAGFSSRFQRVITQGSINDPTNASYGIQINTSASESISLSSAAATPSLYVAGTSGLTTAASGTAADNQGRLVKLTNLSAPQSSFSATVSPTTGTTTAQSTVVDANGNVYMVGNATGSFANQLNQGSQDVYLTKYDSAGNLQWTKLLGSAGSASAASLALNPNGGVVVAGSTTADLGTTAVANSNTDSFVAKYDANGNQTWTTQIQTLNNNQAAAVSVDASGNVYVGGQVTGVIGAGQTSNGGRDAYIAKLASSGKTIYEQQFGTSGNDTVAATAVTASGDLVVASVQNGEAILSKYTGGDATVAPAWQIDLGALGNGGSISGLAVNGNQIYVAGSTQNGALDAGGAAAIANANSGGSDAFVFAATDNGASATPNTVSYVGTGGSDTAGGLTIGSDGTVYLAGTTTGTFAGQTRNAVGTNNTFVTAMSPAGAIVWTRQYGGADGQSAGQAVAFDNSGSSVLDALGLPRGTIGVSQSSDLTSQTTLRAGDSFQIQIEGTAARAFTITIDNGETLQSLVTKINGELGSNGAASISYGANGEGLKIAAGTSVTAKLVAGPANFDALARLGIAAGTLSAGGNSSSSSRAFGLGLATNMNVLTASAAGAARAQLLSVLSAIQKAYQTTNAPASSTGTAAQSGGTVSAYTQSQLSNYSLALNLLSVSNSSTSATG